MEMCPLQGAGIGHERQEASEEKAEAELEEVAGEKARILRAKPMPAIPDATTRSQHNLCHCPPRSWCVHCVHDFSMEDGHRKRAKKPETAVPEIQLDYMLLGNAPGKESQVSKQAAPSAETAKSLMTALHAVDVDTLSQVVIFCQKGPVDYVVKGVCELLREVGRTKVLLRSDNEPSVKALVDSIVAARGDEQTLVEEIPVGSSQAIGVVEHGNYQIGCQVRALRSAAETRLGIKLLPDMAAIAWMVRHAT